MGSLTSYFFCLIQKVKFTFSLNNKFYLVISIVGKRVKMTMLLNAKFKGFL
jgi:hypothetical protein